MHKADFTLEELEILKNQNLSDSFISTLEKEVMTYEDWLLGKWSLMWEGSGIDVVPHKSNGKVVKIVAYVIPLLEWQKVENRKKEILEDFVKAYSDALFSYFDQRFEGSMEKRLLLNNELEKINNLLFAPDWKGIYSAYSANLWLSFRNENTQYNRNLPYWYNSICVEGEDATRAIGPQSAEITAARLMQDGGILHFIVAAIAFKRFKDYLNSKMEAIDDQAPEYQGKIKTSKYCSPEIDNIIEGLIERFDATETEVRLFENFFQQHPYTNLDEGN